VLTKKVVGNVRFFVRRFIESLELQKQQTIY
jgi:hypothetical protein